MNASRFKHFAWTLALAALLLSSCTRPSPPASFYTLRPMFHLPEGSPSPVTGTRTAVGLDLQSFPEVLDRPQIVTRDGANRLKLAELHRWSGPLQGDFLQVLAENLSSLLGTDQVAVAPWAAYFDPTFRVFLEVLQMDGQLGEEVDLKVRWTVTGPEGKKTLLVRTSFIREPLRDGTYDALVAAQSLAVGKLGKEIAEEIVRLQGRPGL